MHRAKFHLIIVICPSITWTISLNVRGLHYWKSADVKFATLYEYLLFHILDLSLFACFACCVVTQIDFQCKRHSIPPVGVRPQQFSHILISAEHHSAANHRDRPLHLGVQVSIPRARASWAQNNQQRNEQLADCTPVCVRGQNFNGIPSVISVR